MDEECTAEAIAYVYDQRYFDERAEWHRRRAVMAPDARTRAVHIKFADLYEAQGRVRMVDSA